MVGTCGLGSEPSTIGSCNRGVAMRLDKAPSDCCDLTLAFLGREKFSTIAGLPVLAGACFSSTEALKVCLTGVAGAECSCGLENSGNLRVSCREKCASYSSGMKGCDERPGKTDRGGGLAGEGDGDGDSVLDLCGMW